MRAYRFLCAKYALQALEEKRLKISRIDQLNDPFELAAPVSNDARHRQAFRKMKSEMARDRGLLCFSRDWQNPLLWSHYADRHQGIALGFDLPDDEVFHVIYRKSRVGCDWARFMDFDSYALGVIDKVMRSKFSHWTYENEVRAHIALDHSTVENDLYFFNFSEGATLREVIVGPQCEIGRTQIAPLVSKMKPRVCIKQARLAFRSFRVVEQHDSRLCK